MTSLLKMSWHYIRAFSVIFLCLYAGNLCSAILPIVIPGSILGMLILFSLLSLNIVPQVWAKPGCQLFMRYMTLLFVPVSVGIMNYYELLVSQFGAIVVSCLVSSLMVLLTVGLLANRIYRDDN